jgi:hypothetical protein
MRHDRSLIRWFALPGIACAALLFQACGPQTSVDEEAAAAAPPAAITADRVIPTGQACTPTGKHQEHRNYACAACHMCAGTVSFDPAIAGPTAAFDATTKNCSSIGCHAVPAGTFTYSYWDWGSDSLAWNTVPYGGTAGGGTANWYAAAGGAGSCDACHGYAPTYNGVAYTWHSGAHGLGVFNGNACQLCHPDAQGAYVWGGPPSYVNTSAGLITSCAPGAYCAAPGTITNASLHGNGVVDVNPGWRSTCNGCH